MQKGYCEETDYRGDSRMINNYNAYSFADLINIISGLLEIVHVKKKEFLLFCGFAVIGCMLGFTSSTLFRKIQTTDLKLEENARIENFIAEK